MKHYNLVVCGGTFDHFHKGHAYFLEKVTSLANEILVGITDDEYAADKKGNDPIEAFRIRKSAVEHFLREKKIYNRTKVATINSVFYPPEWEALPIEAIVVTSQSAKGAQIINQDRGKKGLSHLDVVTCDIVYDEGGLPVSSSRIRNGEINREGRPFVKKEWLADTLLLPEHLRDVFQEPFGRLITHVNKEFLASFDPSRIITVGDVATKTFLDMGIFQKIAVIDYFVERKKTFNNLSEHGFLGNEKVFDVVNPASKINPELFKTIKNMFAELNHQTLVCRVDGEEDLAVIPVLLLSPLGFHVFYGQPKDKGLVCIEVTEEKKEEAYSLAERFVTFTH